MRTARPARWLLAAFVAAGVLSPAGRAAEPEAGMRKGEAPEPVFVRGAEAVAGPELDRWLAAHADDVVRLPVTVWRGPLGGVEAAAIGRVDERPPTALRLSDTALGIALADRLRAGCGAEPRCVVSLSGRFGALLGPADGPTLSVLAFHGLVAPDAPLVAEAARSADCLAIRSMTAVHCARGPKRCATCRELASRPPAPQLLDLCPDDADRVARPVIDVERDGRTSHLVYDVLRTFADADEARAYAAQHGVTDVLLER